MKRILLYIVILGAVLAVPVRPANIGQLLPVQIVSVAKAGGNVILRTDFDNTGEGTTVKEALVDLKDKAAGMIYLDTAQYLLVEEELFSEIEELKEVLKPSIRICATEGVVDLTEAVAYLDVHGQLPKLKWWETGMELPVLSNVRNSLTFLKKVEKRA